TKPAVDLLNKGLVETIVDAQDFDIDSVKSVQTNPRHFEISTSQYASPANKGAFVNKLDFVILAALEVDTDFNVNVITGSDGILRGAPGGHPDASAGAKCTIIVTPLVRGRMATICERVVTVTTPGECVDVVVTDYGVAINPQRPDLAEALKDTGLPLRSIEELRDEAYRIVGVPDELQFEERVVAIMEARDGTILDVVRQIKPFSF
ncbi:MAG: citrate lyase subunit alpha, partial [Clostridiales bacterium]|nr:citrate lyase subunit alpha [Clostridiales bacterium]